MRLKLYSVLSIALVLLFVTQASACSVASPDYYHLRSLSVSDDPDIILVKAAKTYNSNGQDLAFSISKKTLSKNFDATDITSSLGYNISTFKQMSMIENTTGQYISYNDDQSNPVYVFDVTDFGFNNVSQIQGLIYEKLDRMYIKIEFSYNYDYNNWQFSGEQLFGSLSTQRITDNGTHVFPYLLNSVDLDLDIGIAGSPDGGAMCGGPSYYRVTESGFNFIVESVTGTSRLLNKISDALHVLSYNFDDKSSTIKTYSAHGNSVSIFTITDDELLSIINAIETTENTETSETTGTEVLNILTSFSLIIAFSFIFLIRRFKNNKNW